MQAVSTQKFIRMSPRKLRLVANEVRSMSPANALEVLEFTPKRAAAPLRKVIASAVANAAQKGVGVDNLKISEIQIGEGPRLKRGRAVSRGRWHPIVKRMSHIRVVLESVASEPKKTTKRTVKKVAKKKKVNKK